MAASEQVTTRHTQAFTIVELLIVIVVIAILAAITIVAYNGIRQSAQSSALQAELSQAAKKLASARVTSANNLTYPSSLSNAGITSGSLDYYYNSSSNIYCLEASEDDLSYFVVHKATTPKQGRCVSPDQLAGWWPLNGNTEDWSGYNRNGSATSATLTEGQGGQQQGGYAVNNGGMIVAQGPLLASTMTASIWYKSNDVSDTGMIMYAWSANGDGWGGQQEWHIAQQNGEFNMFTNVNGCTIGNQAFGPADTNWHHFAVTFSNNVRRIFFDGNLIASGTNCPSITFAAYDEEIRLGRAQANDERGANGVLDDARVYHRALSNDEISTLYQNGAR